MRLRLWQEKYQMEKSEDLVIYNEEQRYWVNVRDNCDAAVKHFNDSIKLQAAIKGMAEANIEEAAE